jgi:hypothetical protein
MVLKTRARVPLFGIIRIAVKPRLKRRGGRH